MFPGHHMGNITNAATELFGHEVYRCDVNAPIGLDNLAKPHGVILESERFWRMPAAPMRPSSSSTAPQRHHRDDSHRRQSG
jgi:hypothetical protein